MNQEQERAWPIIPQCCQNVDRMKYRCLLAFTIPRRVFYHRAASFSRIEFDATRNLFQLFLELCSRVSTRLKGTISFIMEQALSTDSSHTLAYTFYMGIQNWHEKENDPCEEIFNELIREAYLRTLRYRPKKSERWEEGWHKLSSLSRIKSSLQNHIGFIAHSNESDSGEEWGGKKLGAHIVFSTVHAFALRGSNIRGNQAIWALSKYHRESNLIHFPEPRFIYLVQDVEVREPRLLYNRLFPDWQAKCTPSSAIQFVDALLAPAEERSQHYDHLEDDKSGRKSIARKSFREVTQSYYEDLLGIKIDMGVAHETSGLKPRYTQVHTYDSLSKIAEGRLARIDDVAHKRTHWAQLEHPVNTARRLYDLHQLLGFEVHESHMRGAFLNNVSPPTIALMRYAEEYIFLAEPTLGQHSRTYSDLDRFCNREIWRWKQFDNTYLVARHNIGIMMLISYASLDAYSCDLIRRVGLNLLLHTEEGGVGKSELLGKILLAIRICIENMTYKTAKSQAVSSQYGEQCYRINVMEELQESMVTSKGPGSTGEMARIYKTMLSNPRMHAETLRYDPATGNRIPCKDISLWLGCCLAAANIKGLTSWVMDPPILDRHIIITLDQSSEAQQNIIEKSREFDVKASDPTFIQDRERVSKIFKQEEFVYAEHRMLEREKVVYPTSRDIAAIACDWLLHHLEEAGYPINVRNREKFCALAANIALLDAVDTVYFDKGGLSTGMPYDIRAHSQVERRNWINVSHFVHAIGLAPSLFIDLDERDVRLALCEEFESMPCDKTRFARSNLGQRLKNTDEIHNDKDDDADDNDDDESEEEENDAFKGHDPSYASFRIGHLGLKGLTTRIQTRLRNSKNRRILLTQDAIRYRLQKWTGMNAPLDTWKNNPDDQWPTSTSDDGVDGNKKRKRKNLQPIARLVDIMGGTLYQVQLGWIHRDMLPEPADMILLSHLRGLFACRNQGGFSAPYGSDPKTGDIRIVRFEPSDPEASYLIVPGLQGEDPYLVDEPLNAWGLNQHNSRLYIDKIPTRRLGNRENITATVTKTSSTTCFFSGRPLTDLLAPRTVDEELALKELTTDLEMDKDDIDALDTDMIVDRINGLYHWDVWTKDGCERYGYLPIDPDDSAEKARTKHIHNRGLYKRIAPLPSIEEDRIKRRLRDPTGSVEVPPECWSDRSKIETKKRKHVWKAIRSGKSSFKFLGGIK